MAARALDSDGEKGMNGTTKTKKQGETILSFFLAKESSASLQDPRTVGGSVGG